MPMILTRSLLTVLIPGLVAVSPWLVWLVQHTSATIGAEQSAVLSNALIFALVVVVGSTCEGMGTYLECRWDDKLEATYQVEEHWIRYLRYTGQYEPVAFRYLSRLVTTLYFELSMFFATPIFIAGATVLGSLRFSGYSYWIIPVGVVFAIGSALYFHYQARQTHEVICKVRKEIDLPGKPVG